MDALHQQGPVGTQGSEAALSGPVGAVQPHSGCCALLSLSALYDLLQSSWSLSSGRPWRMPIYKPQSGASLASRNQPGSHTIQSQPHSLGNHLVFNSALLCSFRPDQVVPSVLQKLLHPCSCMPSAPLSPPMSSA